MTWLETFFRAKGRTAVLSSAFLLTTLAQANSVRGELYEYDPGPPLHSQWPELFAETPNYRGIAKYFLMDDPSQKENFRWPFGPMFYRGRLEAESVKVFVIGQDSDLSGAQDENLSNRAFVGHAGGQLQSFLSYFGIDRSYLFMNTYNYGLRNPELLRGHSGSSATFDRKFEWLSYHSNSPIVQHRHRMFDYMLKTNQKTLSLILAVGTAGFRSVQAWVRSHGGKCDAVEACQLSVLSPRLKMVLLPHPEKEKTAAIENAFVQASVKIMQWALDDTTWLKADNLQLIYKRKLFSLENLPLPYRDFSFGAMPRLGEGQTVSNRKDPDQQGNGYRSLQVFSSNGCFDNTQKSQGSCLKDQGSTLAPREPLRFLVPHDTQGDAQMARRFIPLQDHPWEAPRSRPRDFDPGPSRNFAKLLTGSLPQLPWPNFNSLGVTSHASFGTGAIYRGRLNQARVLILADQFGHDDLFSGRALTGEAGQKIQSFLESTGVTHSYAMIRSLPVDTLDLDPAKRLQIARHPKVRSLTQEILSQIKNQSQSQVLLAIGDLSIDLAKELGSRPDWDEVPIIYMESPFQYRYGDNWQLGLDRLKQLNLAPDQLGFSPDYVYKTGERSIVPRYDLPAQTRWWMGTSGDRASRAQLNGAYSGDYYRLYVPEWVFDLEAPELDQKTLDQIKNWELDTF